MTCVSPPHACAETSEEAAWPASVRSSVRRSSVHWLPPASLERVAHVLPSSLLCLRLLLCLCRSLRPSHKCKMDELLRSLLVAWNDDVLMTWHARTDTCVHTERQWMAALDLVTDFVFCFDIFAQFHTAVWNLIPGTVQHWELFDDLNYVRWNYLTGALFALPSSTPYLQPPYPFHLHV